MAAEDRESVTRGDGFRTNEDLRRTRDFGAQNGGNNLFDPLFLSNSDNPGMQLVSAHFDGTNFQSWSRNVKLALGAKMKLGFINGVFPKPDRESEDFDRWERCDCMVMSWIINSMVSEISQNFMYALSAQELWNELVERYAESNAPLIYQLQWELSNIKQENLSVASYYSKLKKVWDELQAIEGIPICSCGVFVQCSCALMKRIVDRESTTKLMQFLMGLSDPYENVRNTILSTEPLPTVNRAFHMVMQIERQKEITGNSSISHDALAVNRAGNTGQSRNSGGSFRNSWNASNGMNAGFNSVDNGRGSYTRDNNNRDFSRDFKKIKYDRKCAYCHENGHVKETCFKLVGYPEWWKGPRVEGSGKMMANVQDINNYNSPLDIDERESSKAYNSLVNAVVQEVLKAMKGKAPMEESSSTCHVPGNTINFAGPYN